MWSSEVLKPNPAGKITVHKIGLGEHKLVTVDDFYLNPEQVAEMAMGLFYIYGRVNGNFPGGRAVVSLDTRPLAGVLAHLWGAPLRPFGEEYQPAMFSSIIHKPDELNIAQRSPHIDPGVSAMIWLNPDEDCQGGTGLYRHKLTGLERLPVTPTPALIEFATPYGYPAPFFKTPADYTTFQDSLIFNPLFAAEEGYINDGNDYWELMQLTEMKFNRLVIFDGRIPHSQYIKDGWYEDRVRINQIAYLQGPD